jgi:hypothetical protein
MGATALKEDSVLLQPDEVTIGKKGEECDEVMEMCRKNEKRMSQLSQKMVLSALWGKTSPCLGQNASQALVIYRLDLCHGTL